MAVGVLVASAATLSVLYALPSDVDDARDPDNAPTAREGPRGMPLLSIPGPGGVPLQEGAVVTGIYLGSANHDADCRCWAVVDTLTISRATFEDTERSVGVATVTPSELHDAVVFASMAGGWEPMLLNGALVLTRRRQVEFPTARGGLGRLLAAHQLSIILPSAQIGDVHVRVRLADESWLRLKAPDKAVSATDPAYDGRELLAQGREQVDVPVADTRPSTSSGRGSVDVVVDLLSPWARIGAVGPAIARMQTGGLAAVALVGTLGLVGVTGRPPLLPMLRSAVGRLRARWRSRREGRPADAVTDDHGYL